jgi:predicted  nucleic acid-binding Zn-ribbon protein
MAQLKESLSADVLNSIKEKRDEVSNLVMELGQIGFRNRELRNELAKLDQIKASIENRFDEVNEEIKSILVELEVKYPKGEIDLQEGVVYFESAE